MPKQIEKVPETVAELKAALPELCAQIEQDAVAAVDTAGIAAKAATAERERLLGILTVEIGEESAGRISALIATGVTVEQLTAIKAMQPPQDPAASTAEAAKKAEILAALKGSGAPNAGHDGGPISHPGDKDYMTLVEEYVVLHKCGKAEAMQAVTRKHPEKHRAYIKNANEGRA